MLFIKQRVRKNSHANRRLTQRGFSIFKNTEKVEHSESAVDISTQNKATYIQRQILLFFWFLSDLDPSTQICSIIRNVVLCAYTNKYKPKTGV